MEKYLTSGGGATNADKDTGLVLHRESEMMFSAIYAGKPIGKIALYRNAFHSRNQYLRLHLAAYNSLWAAQLFSQLQEAVQKSLQVMLSSEDTRLAAFLTAGGFACKRRCFEMEVTAKDFVTTNNRIPLETAEKDLPEYDLCCQLLYDYYKQTHAAINPLSADLTAFCESLPPKVFYQKTEGEIKHVAFVEENEIAYTGSTDVGGIRPFAETVAATLFGDYETLCFECDDCDAAAMVLKGLFCTEVQESFDTYVRSK